MYLYTCCADAARKDNSTGRACWGKKKKREKRGCAFAPATRQMLESKYAMKVCVSLSEKTFFKKAVGHLSLLQERLWEICLWRVSVPLVSLIGPFILYSPDKPASITDRCVNNSRGERQKAAMKIYRGAGGVLDVVAAAFRLLSGSPRLSGRDVRRSKTTN